MLLNKIEKQHLAAILEKNLAYFKSINNEKFTPELQESLKYLEEKIREFIQTNNYFAAKELLQSMTSLKINLFNNDELMQALNSMIGSISNSNMPEQTKKEFINSISKVTTDNKDIELARVLLSRILNRLHSETQKKEWMANLYSASLKFFTAAMFIIVLLIILNFQINPIENINKPSFNFIIQMGLFGSLGAIISGIRNIRKFDTTLTLYNVLITTTFARPFTGFALGITSFYILQSNIVIFPGIEKNLNAYFFIAFCVGFSEDILLNILKSLKPKANITSLKK